MCKEKVFRVAHHGSKSIDSQPPSDLNDRDERHASSLIRMCDGIGDSSCRASGVIDAYGPAFQSPD